MTEALSKLPIWVRLLFIVFCLGIIAFSFKSLSKNNIDPRDILEVPDVAPAPGEPGTLEGGVPQAISDILQVSDIDFTAYDKNLARFIKLEIGMPMDEAETTVLNYYAPMTKEEGNVVFEMDKLQGYVGGQAFVATIDGIADDSVKAQQLYAIGKKGEGEDFTLVDYGLRLKCWRGDTPNTWSTDLCP